MAIERLVWTEHALDRCRDRWIDKEDLERAIHGGHDEREPNDGEADWRICALTGDGRRFAVLYDHPVRGDDHAIRIVSVMIFRHRS